MHRASKAYKKYRRYSEEQIVAAVQDCKGSSIRDSARHHGVPESTVRGRLRGNRSRSGPPTILTTGEEDMLVKWIISMARMGFGQTRQDVCCAVKKLLDGCGRKTPLLENRPGQTWYYSFLARHPEIALRQPQPLIRPRAQITTEATNMWFSNLVDYLAEEEEGDILKEPTRIFNADESGFALQPKSSRVLAEKGSRTVTHFSGDNRSQITVLACISADGAALPPLIVMQGKRFAFDPLEGFSEAHLGRSENGWMDSELFLLWLKDLFLPYIIEHSIERPVLLLVDGHSSHTTFEAADFCFKSGIILYCLLAHASHLLQPCDRGLFGPMKAAWRYHVHDYMNANPGCSVTRQNFSGIFKKAWEKAATEVNVRKGFQAAGIFPFKPANGAPRNSLTPTSPTSTESLAMQEATQPCDQTTSTTSVSTATDKTPVVASTSASKESLPSPASTVVNPDESQASIPPCPVPGAVLHQISVWVTPEMIQSAVFKVPDIQLQKKKGNVPPCNFPKAVSSKEVRRILAEKRSQRDEKEQAKKARMEAKLQKEMARKVKDSDTESSESFDSSESEQSQQEIKPKVGDFILVKFATKKSWQGHIGKILKIAGSEVSSQFLLRQSGSRLRFKFPMEEDICVHEMSDIVSLLPMPTTSGTSGRLSMSFDFDFSKFQMA